MKKQLFMFGMMFAIVNFNTTNAEVDTLSFYDEMNEKAQWEFLEAKFITNIARAKKLSWKHIEAIVPAIFGSIATYKTLEAYDSLPFVTSTFNKESDPILGYKNPQVYYPIISITAGAILTYQYAQCYISNQANRDALENFFANYEDNQFLVPAELQDAFFMIAERIELEGMDAVLADANNYVDIITDIVMRHFESRYKSIFDAKGRDALSESKTIIENFKNVFDGASKFGSK